MTTSGEPGTVGDVGEPVAEQAVEVERAPVSVVDFAATIRRLRISLSIIAGVVMLAWLAVGVASGGLSGRLLAEFAGLGVFASFAVEVVVVGGSAARGMLRAGERGDRLAGGDVSLLPPQLTRAGRSGRTPRPGRRRGTGAGSGSGGE